MTLSVSCFVDGASSAVVAFASRISCNIASEAGKHHANKKVCVCVLVCVRVCVRVCPSLSVCLPVCLPACLSVYVSVSLCLCFCACLCACVVCGVARAFGVACNHDLLPQA